MMKIKTPQIWIRVNGEDRHIFNNKKIIPLEEKKKLQRVKHDVWSGQINTTRITVF